MRPTVFGTGIAMESSEPVAQGVIGKKLSIREAIKFRDRMQTKVPTRVAISSRNIEL